MSPLLKNSAAYQVQIFNKRVAENCLRFQAQPLENCWNIHKHNYRYLQQADLRPICNADGHQILTGKLQKHSGKEGQGLVIINVCTD